MKLFSFSTYHWDGWLLVGVVDDVIVTVNLSWFLWWRTWNTSSSVDNELANVAIYTYTKVDNDLDKVAKYQGG